jgi:Lrp/AsnC family leucine-responsive transcriptional regulator
VDSIDRRIVRELQRDARISNQDLAERVNLSPSPCLRRVRRLEALGVLRGYTAIVDEEQLGLPVTAFVEVRLEQQNEATIRAFEAGVQALDEVLACYLMAGARDYLLHVVAPSLKSYETFVRGKLTRIPGIGELETHFAFGRVKFQPSLPDPQQLETR